MASGFLSSNNGDSMDDKGFLQDHDRQTKTSGEYSARRSRIRERIRQGIFDFSLVFDHLPAQERKQTFEGQDVSHPNRPGRDISDGEFAPGMLSGWKGNEFELIKGDAELISSITDTIAFLWLACYDAQVEPEEVMEAGIENAMDSINRPRRSADVTLRHTVSHDQRQRKAVQGRKKMANGDELADNEARALIDCEEEVVPDALLFDYLRGEIDSYELHPFPFEDTSDKQPNIGVEPGISDEELDEALGDEFTVRDGTIIYGDVPPELDDGTREAVVVTLIERRDFVETGVDGLVTNNENIDSPVPAPTFLDWLHTLHDADIEPLADEAGVTVPTFRRVLSQNDGEIKTRLAEEYDDIEYIVTDPIGVFDETDTE